jgi:hypothetical protein
MHYGRITTIVGSVLAIIGLGLQSASSAAEDLMPALNEATAGAVPSGFDRIFTAMWDDNAAGTGIFVIALVAVLGLSLIPNIKEALSRMNSLVVVVLGVVMLVVGVIATKGALDDASTLQDGFAAMAAAAQIPEAFTVSISVGWYLLPIGGAIAAIGAVLQLMKRSDEDALTS